MKGACEGVDPGNRMSTLANIAPAIYAVGDAVDGPRTSANKGYVQAVAQVNVCHTVQRRNDDAAQQARGRLPGCALAEGARSHKYSPAISNAGDTTSNPARLVSRMTVRASSG